MSLYVQHVIGMRPSNRVAPGPHPGLRNYRLEWVPRDTHGVSRIEVHKMWGLCLAGGAAIGRGRVSSGNATDGDGDRGVVESVSQDESASTKDEKEMQRAGLRGQGRVEGQRGGGMQWRFGKRQGPWTSRESARDVTAARGGGKARKGPVVRAPKVGRGTEGQGPGAETTLTAP